MNCSTIDMKVLSGNIEGLNKEARSELVVALLNKFHQVQQTL